MPSDIEEVTLSVVDASGVDVGDAELPYEEVFEILFYLSDFSGDSDGQLCLYCGRPPLSISVSWRPMVLNKVRTCTIVMVFPVRAIRLR